MTMTESNVTPAPNGTDEEREVPEIYSGDNVRASWPFSLHDIRKNMAHCSPEKREVMISAFLWCVDAKHPVSRADFSSRVNYAPNTVYKVYTGKHMNPANDKKYDVPDALFLATKKFLDVERARYSTRTDFILTPTAKKIFLACELARESQTPVFLTGRSHIGKTVALEQYTASNNHGRTSYTRMKAASGLGGMVRRLAERHGVSPNGNTADLIDRLKNAVTADMCLILDEMHLLMYTYRKASFFACMEVIREIYDESGCGMVLCGTQLLLDKVNEGKSGEMEQLLRRGVHRVVLPDMPTKGDLAAILNHYGLEFPKRGDTVEVAGVTEKPYDLLRQLAKEDGLKSITERIRYARRLASRDEAPLTWQHVVHTHLIIEEQGRPQQEGW